LCGTESLDQAIRKVPPVAIGVVVSNAVISQALEEMRPLQVLKQATGAHHAAAWCDLAGNVHILREDVGRHNALDKLIGAMTSAGIDCAQGFVAITSRASVEMVQKAATAGVQLLAAASVPTALAVRSAAAAQLTLVTSVRGSGMNIQTRPERVSLDHQ
jgi:FdhD protein